MRIEHSGFTYKHVYGPNEGMKEAGSPKEHPNRVEKQQPDAFVPSKPDAPDETQASGVKCVDGADVSQPLSSVLTPEEKEMLQRLFPPMGRNIGVRAYKQGQAPFHNREMTGKKLDLKT